MTWDPTAGALTDPFAALSGNEVAAIDLTADITGNFNALQAAIWTAPTTWTPGWASSGTAPVLGNGNNTGSIYERLGQRMMAFGQINLGSTTSIGSGFYKFGVPAALHASLIANTPVGWMSFVDTSAGLAYQRTLVVVDSTTLAAVDASGVVLGAATPAVPANGDSFRYGLSYITA